MIHSTSTLAERARSPWKVATLERLTISCPPIDGIVLRYGHLYGPGTGTNTADAPALHVDAAAWAAVLAIEKAHRGIYNIAEADTCPWRKHSVTSVSMRTCD